MYSMKTCSVENCTRSVYSFGKCNPHYRREKYGNGKDKTSPVREYTAPGKGMEFLHKAAKSDTNACILWPYCEDGKGYGKTFYQKKHFRAHRVALILKDGIENPPKNVFACHKCDNRLCVNPKHIYWGDGKSNAEDRERFWFW